MKRAYNRTKLEEARVRIGEGEAEAATDTDTGNEERRVDPAGE
jgi:hypothetical protein